MSIVEQVDAQAVVANPIGRREELLCEYFHSTIRDLEKEVGEFADASEGVEAERDRAFDERDEMEDKCGDLETERDGLQDKYDDVKVELDALQAELDQAQQQG